MSSSEENELPETPWDIQVDRRVQENNLSKEAARDVVIIEWLRKGNTTPFTAFVSAGHIPSIDIIKYVALMMNPPDGNDELVPYALEVSSRGKRGSRRDPAIEERNKLMAKNVKRLIEEGKTYNKALDEVADLVGEGLDNDPRDTVEKAYKRYKSKI